MQPHLTVQQPKLTEISHTLVATQKAKLEKKVWLDNIQALTAKLSDKRTFSTPKHFKAIMAFPGQKPSEEVSSTSTADSLRKERAFDPAGDLRRSKALDTKIKFVMHLIHSFEAAYISS